jgi:hypothetical protein
VVKIEQVRNQKEYTSSSVQGEMLTIRSEKCQIKPDTIWGEYTRKKFIKQKKLNNEGDKISI